MREETTDRCLIGKVFDLQIAWWRASLQGLVGRHQPSFSATHERRLEKNVNDTAY